MGNMSGLQIHSALPIIDECSIITYCGAAQTKFPFSLFSAAVQSGSSFSYSSFQFQSDGLVPCFFSFFLFSIHMQLSISCRLTGWMLGIPFDIILSLLWSSQVHSTVMISYDIIQLLQNILARVQAFKKARGWRLPPHRVSVLFSRIISNIVMRKFAEMPTISALCQSLTSYIRRVYVPFKMESDWLKTTTTFPWALGFRSTRSRQLKLCERSPGTQQVV